MHSAIYEGRVSHQRFTPVEHAFEYGLFMMYLDLDELPQLFDNHRWWSNDGRGIARFRRRDHLKGHAPPTQDLGQAVRNLVAKQTGVAPSGPIRLLTHLEYFRHRFNPVSLFFCFDPNDQHVEAIVVEINNTPWKEQHCYVHSVVNQPKRSDAMQFEFGKAFHISPFVGMDMEYDWRFSQPGEKLCVVMDTLQKGVKHINATLTMQRREMSSASLNRVLYRYPLMTLHVLGAIYWQALRLRLKGCPRYTHPATLARQNRGVKTC